MTLTDESLHDILQLGTLHPTAVGYEAVCAMAIELLARRAAVADTPANIEHLAGVIFLTRVSVRRSWRTRPPSSQPSIRLSCARWRPRR